MATVATAVALSAAVMLASMVWSLKEPRITAPQETDDEQEKGR